MTLNFISMSSSRDSVDLWIVLTDPRCARAYIASFDWQQPQIPDRIEVDSGRMIDLEQISDEDAVVVASHLLRHYEIPREMEERKIAEDLNEIH